MEKNYDFKTIEKDMQRLWNEDKTYAFDPNSKKPLYSIDTPPPTVSGSLHMGHIFSYTQAEIIARYHRMTGKNVFYPFGFDDNGLPTERLVEKEEKVLARNLSREDFRQRCETTVRKYIDEFKHLWQALGFCCDWNLEYHTISEESQKLSQEKFLELTKSGDAYLKKAPILWCTSCQTSIAQAELEYIEIDSEFHTIVFKCVVGRDDPGAPSDIHIATTRPEMLAGCVAVLINPEDKRFNKLIGKKAKVPLYNYEVPVIGDESVDIEKGTGIVMCCTFGDITDLEWVNKYNLETKSVVGADGFIVKDIEFIAGLKIKEARAVIVEKLKEAGLLIKSESIKHNVAVHDRCNTPNEIILSSQWYISTLKYKKELLEQGAKVTWYPEHMRKKYDIWVENLKWDWCISRQRFFGVPIPVWYCKDCNKVMYANEKQLPVNPISTKPPVNKCACGCTEFVPETSVFDTWMTSSITPQIDEQLAKKAGYKGEFLPCGMRTHAHEIIRTWSFYTILKSYLHRKEIPWKHLMICGFVLAKKGEKLSKSKDNSLYSPKNLIENYSVDMIRYCAASSKLGTDSYFSAEEIEISQRQVTKLWNASKFVLFQLQNYELSKPKKLLPVDEWILNKSKTVMRRCKEYLNEYEAFLAKKEIEAFFWNDFCDNYLEIVKDRLYKEDVYGKESSDSARYALYQTFLNILKLFGIYMPHITEYVYQQYFIKFEKSVTLHRLQWDNDENVNEYLNSFGEVLCEIISKVRRFKTENKFSMKEPIDKLTVKVEKQYLESFKACFADIKVCTTAAEMEIVKSKENDVTIEKM